MSASLNSFSALWSRFVTADGAAYTAGRLTLALVISVLLFPFGLGIVVALWAMGLPVTPMPSAVLDESGPQDTGASRLAYRAFFAALVIPSLAGASVHLLNEGQIKVLGEACLAVANLSFLPSSLDQWMDYLARSPLRGTKYAVTCITMFWTAALLPAELMRKMQTLMVRATGRTTGIKWKSLRSGRIVAVVVGCLVVPFLYGSGNVDLLKMSRPAFMADPDIDFTTFLFPITLLPVGGLTFGVFGLWSWLTGIRMRCGNVAVIVMTATTGRNTMSASLNSFSALWSRFVTADGAAYTAGRLTLALVISVLLFPFGLAIVVLIWSLRIDPKAEILRRHFGGEYDVPKRISRKAWLILACCLVVPTLIGASVHLLSGSMSARVGDFGLSLAEYSFFPNSLRDWFDAYTHANPTKGSQFVVSALSIGIAPAMIGAQTMRHLSFLPNNYAGLALLRRQAHSRKWLLLFFVLGSLVGPAIYFLIAPQSAQDLGLAGPGSMLSAFSIPLAVGPVSGLLIGAFALWVLSTIFRLQLFEHFGS